MTRYEAIEKALEACLWEMKTVADTLRMYQEYHGCIDQAKDALALPEDSKTVNAELSAYTVKRSWPEWLGVESLPRSGPVLIVHENDSGERWVMEWEASRYHAERMKESQHNFPPHLIWAKAINWMPSPPLPGEVTLVFCNTCGHPSNANDVSTTRVVNAELYGLAVKFADDFARFQFPYWLADMGGYFLVDEYTIKHNVHIAYSLHYFQLREASGEPMPYRVVRDGDKVRFI